MSWEKSVPIRVADALAADPGERFDVVALEQFRLIAGDLNGREEEGKAPA